MQFSKWDLLCQCHPAFPNGKVLIPVDSTGKQTKDTILDLFASANLFYSCATHHLCFTEDECSVSHSSVWVVQSSPNTAALRSALAPAIISTVSLLNCSQCDGFRKEQSFFFSSSHCSFEPFLSLKHRLGDTVTFWSVSVTEHQTLSKCQSPGLSGTLDSEGIKVQVMVLTLKHFLSISSRPGFSVEANI